MFLNLKFEVKQHKNVFGRRTGRLSVMMGKEEIFADTKEELAAKCHAFIERVSKEPQIGYAKVGEQFLISVHHDECVSTYRANDDNPPDGVVPLRCISFGGTNIHEVTEGNAVHLLQCQWKPGDGVPEACPDRLKSDFAYWTRWQEEHYAANASS